MIIDGIPQPAWVMARLRKLKKTGKYGVVFWNRRKAGCATPMPNQRSENKEEGFVSAWVPNELKAGYAVDMKTEYEIKTERGNVYYQEAADMDSAMGQLLHDFILREETRMRCRALNAAGWDAKVAVVKATVTYAGNGDYATHAPSWRWTTETDL